MALAAEESPLPCPAGPTAYWPTAIPWACLGTRSASQHSQTVTMEQVEALARTVGDKLALLDLEPRPASRTALVLDTTRGGVMNALYQGGRRLLLPRCGAGPRPL